MSDLRRAHGERRRVILSLKFARWSGEKGVDKGWREVGMKLFREGLF
jgi:hypothetical protein